MRWKRQATALERQQVLLRTEIICTAEKLEIEDDIFVLHRLVASLAKRMQRPRHEHEDVPHLRRKTRRTDLDDPLAPLDKHQLHILVPVQRHLRKIPRDRAGIDIKRKTQRTMLLRLLKRCLIFHCLLLL